MFIYISANIYRKSTIIFVFCQPSIQYFHSSVCETETWKCTVNVVFDLSAHADMLKMSSVHGDNISSDAHLHTQDNSCFSQLSSVYRPVLYTAWRDRET